MPLYLLVVLVVMINCGTLAYGPHHPRGPHSHHRPHSDGKLTRDTHLLHDKEHIQEDLKEIIHDDVTKNMPPQELEFYYFKIHDADNNSKLDGLEILRAVQHTAHEENGEEEDIDMIIDLIDLVLEEDDLDKDGFLSYMEYVNGRSKYEKSQPKQETGHS